MGIIICVLVLFIIFIIIYIFRIKENFAIFNKKLIIGQQIKDENLNINNSNIHIGNRPTDRYLTFGRKYLVRCHIVNNHKENKKFIFDSLFLNSSEICKK